MADFTFKNQQIEQKNRFNKTVFKMSILNNIDNGKLLGILMSNNM